MPERLHPGVYIEEVSGGVRPIEGVATSTAAFVGETARGVPGLAQFCASFTDYQRIFGSHSPGEAGLVAQAVDAFFASGGRRAYVVRVLPADASRAVSSPLLTRQGGTLEALTVLARGAGDWAESLRVNIGPATNFPAEAFKLEVQWTEAGTTRTLETFDDVRMDPDHEDYLADRVNEISKYIVVVDEFAAAVDAAPGTQHLAAVPPQLVTKVLAAASDKYALYEGTELTFSYWDNADPDAGRSTLAVKVNPSTVNAAITTSPPAFSNGKVELTPVQLNALIAKTISDAGTSSPFTSSAPSDTSVKVSVKAGTGPRLTIAAPGGGTYDLDGETVTLTLNGTPKVVPIVAADLTAVTSAELHSSIAAAMAGSAVATLNPDNSIAVEGAAGEGAGTLTGAVSPTAAALSVSTAAGTPGALPSRFDGLQMSVSELLSPATTPVLRTLGFSARSSGYVMNSGANPLARPVETKGVKLAGGTDGILSLTTSDFSGDDKLRTGMHALDRVDVQLVALPGKNDPAYISAGIAYCDNRGDCFFLADGPGGVEKDFIVTPDDAKQFIEGLPSRSKNAAMFYPWIRVPDPVGVGRNPTRLVPPSGHMAGIFARTDNTRGVWKAPAGIEAQVPEALGLQYPVIDQEQDLLNPVSLNCLRQFPGVGIVSWGSRTLSPDPEWRYIPVRRMALFLQESVRRGLRWAVFEPNDQELWDQIRINLESFMLGLFRQGAFQGANPEEAFKVACDRSTNPQELVDAGVVTADISWAPVKPAEFVTVRFQQKSLLATAAA
ncbi:MAG TPA: phage tail sheath C-terminal domain-containing protein [Myxococcaceae bacterium]|nr:phage tail sheath C-terminal domain-containing protein [Myxococcaceae bacterium]